MESWLEMYYFPHGLIIFYIRDGLICHTFGIVYKIGNETMARHDGQVTLSAQLQSVAQPCGDKCPLNFGPWTLQCSLRRTPVGHLLKFNPYSSRV